MSPRTGRPAGKSRAREQILAAARAAFAESGYDAATIRDVARRAGVDPALVHHYFGAKQQLFVAAVELPVDPTELIARIFEGDVESLGDRIAHTFLGVWDGSGGGSPMVALIRSATSNDQAAAMFREFITANLLGALADRLDAADSRLRATLAASQLIGVALLRYVIRLEPLASAPADEVAALIAPTLQRYLTGDLGSAR